MSDAIEPRDRVLPALLGDPSDVPDALVRLARIGAVRAWLGERDAEVRGWLNRTADEVEETTGAAFNAPVHRLGRVLRTNPQPRPAVVDVDAFAAWVHETWPGGPHVRSVIRVEVDEKAALEALEVWYDSVVDEERLRAAHLLAEALGTREEWYVDDGLLDLLLKDETLIVLDGRVVRADPDTGEVEDVPGVEVRPPVPSQLQVRIDRAAVTAAQVQLRAALGE